MTAQLRDWVDRLEAENDGLISELAAARLEVDHLGDQLEAAHRRIAELEAVRLDTAAFTPMDPETLS